MPMIPVDLSYDFRGGDAEALAVSQVEACAREIGNWMCCNTLKLNGDKSELLFIGSQYRLRPLLSSLTTGCSVVQSSASTRNLGVVLDNGLTFEKHISAICKLAFYHLRKIAKIRSYLSEESTIALIHAYITCRLNNGNALLY